MKTHSLKQCFHLSESLRSKTTTVLAIFVFILTITAVYTPRTANAHYYRPYSSTIWVFPSSSINVRLQQPELFEAAPTLFMEGKTWAKPQYPPEPVISDSDSQQPELFDAAPTLFMEGKTWAIPQYPPDPVIPEAFKTISDPDTAGDTPWSNRIIPRAHATEPMTDSGSVDLVASVIPTVQAAASDSETQEALTITKTSTEESVAPGDLLTYRIVVANNTDAPISEIVVMDHVSSHTQLDAATPRARTQDDAAWWEDQTIPPEGMTYFLRVRVGDTVPDGTVLENTVEAWGPDVHVSTTDTTPVVSPSNAVSPTVDTGPGTGIMLLIAIATAVSAGGAITVHKLYV